MVRLACFLSKGLGSNLCRLGHRKLSTSRACNSNFAVLGIGNPLVDFTVFDDHGLMKRYGITPNTVSEIGPAHHHIFEEVQHPPHKPITVLGGATQNTIRIAQWSLGDAGKAAFYGSVANDALGKLMLKLAEDSAVDIHYKVRDGVRTGASLSVNLADEASMVIDYGTASSFNTDAFSPELKPLMLKSKIIYLGAYMWSMSPRTAKSIARFVTENNMPLATDLQSVRFCPYFASTQHDSLKHIDMLFGNAVEAVSLAQCLARSSFPFASDFSLFLGESHATTDLLMEIAKRVAALPTDSPSKFRRVVFTHGAHPVVYCDGSTGEVATAPTIPMQPKSIKDPRGRGDAFIGGFLASMAEGADMLTACMAGMVASEAVLQSIGCNPRAKAMTKR